MRKSFPSANFPIRFNPWAAIPLRRSAPWVAAPTRPSVPCPPRLGDATPRRPLAPCPARSPRAMGHRRRSPRAMEHRHDCRWVRQCPAFHGIQSDELYRAIVHVRPVCLLATDQCMGAMRSHGRVNHMNVILTRFRDRIFEIEWFC
jgi:hypothetical protein